MGIKITYSDYIKGRVADKGSLTKSQTKLIIDDYKSRFDKLLVREAGNFPYHLYKDEDKYYIHVSVPSENTRNVYYDVVIEFSTTKEIVDKKNNIDLANARFFSNDPAFVFNYAYVFKHKGIIIDWLEKKISKRALEEKAVIKNPNQQLGHIKSLYFAYFFIKINHLFFVDPSWRKAEKLVKTKVLKSISSSTAILERIAEQKEIAKQKKKEEERKTKPITIKRRSAKLDVKSSRRVGLSKKVKRVGIVRRTPLSKKK